MILLINIKTTKPSEIQTEYFREPSLGLLYLAAVLDNNGHAVDILDLEQYYHLEEEELEQVILKRVQNYDVIGITTLTNTFNSSLKIAKQIKSFDNSKFIVLGGPHASFQYDVILEQYPFIDFICIGEAEESFLKLVNLLIKFKDNLLTGLELESQLTKIGGIAFKKLKNETIYTGFPEPINLDTTLLPARYLLSQDNYYYRVANIIVNRGCPNQCSFCSRQNLFKNVRIRSLESIKAEIEDILSYQTYDYINFYDNININPNFLEHFCHLFIDNKIKIPWGCELRVDTINKKQAELLKEAGCKVIASGIESSDLKVLQLNLKYQNPEKVKEGIKHLKDVGMSLQLYFVLGLPGETIGSVEETLNFIKNLPLTKNDTIDYFAATPYPGSRLWEEYDKYRIKIIEYDFSKYDCQHIIFETENLDLATLNRLLHSAKEIETYFK